MNYPILILETNDWIVVYVQGNKHKEGHELMPCEWMKLGALAAQMGIQDYSVHIKKVFICEHEVSDESILWSFPDKVDQLHKDIVNVINGVENKAVSVVEDDKEKEDSNIENNLKN